MSRFVFTFSEADVAAILRRYPTLGSHGLSPPSSRDNLKPFTPAKAADPILIKLALFMARHTRFTTNIKTNHSASTSYGWKHVAERALGAYVCNGEFILTALLLGHAIKQCAPNHTNCYLNMAVGSPELQDMVQARTRGPLPCFARLQEAPAQDNVDDLLGTVGQ